MKKTDLEKLDLTLYYDKVCGLDVYVVPKKANSCYAVYTTKYGEVNVNQAKLYDDLVDFLAKFNSLGMYKLFSPQEP